MSDVMSGADRNADSAAFCAGLVRGHDFVRYASTLFVPSDKRRALLALYAFNVEIYRVRDQVTQPLPGEIRMQWWSDMLAGGGRMALLGLPSGPVSLDLTDQVIFKEARLFGVTGREIFATWEQTSSLLASGMVDPAPVITHRFGLEEFEEAFDVLASGRSGKIILLP